MKKFILIGLLFGAAGMVCAQEVQEVKGIQALTPDSVSADSTSVESLELVPMTAADSLVTEDTAVEITPLQPSYTLWNDRDLTDIELRSLDWSLQ